MRKFLSLSMLMLCGVWAVSQTHTISGTVKDEAGVPVSGASVIIKGTALGVPADAAGEFKISAKAGDVLQISAANFVTSEVRIGAQNAVSVNLKRGNNMMEEVVVTALGQTSRKAKVGYSTSTFNSEAINKTASVNVLNGLAGKIAGAEISSVGGPGSSTKVILRGYGVISG